MSDSPVKKPSFLVAADKENAGALDSTVAVKVAGIPEIDLPEPQATKEESGVAPTIKKEEANEPLLQENPHRFVLFPIQHHEVRGARQPRRVETRL